MLFPVKKKKKNWKKKLKELAALRCMVLPPGSVFLHPLLVTKAKTSEAAKSGVGRGVGEGGWGGCLKGEEARGGC